VARNAQRRAGSPGPSFFLSRRRMLAALGCAIVALGATGTVVLNGGGKGTAEAAPVAAPACASAGTGVAPPPDVPAAVLPPGTIVTSVRHPRSGTTMVSGVIASPFRSAVEFFVTKLPSAGYVNTTGDAEMDEAESYFQGAEVLGKWKVNGILGCPDAVRLALFVRS
jgi:hypothetical protein